MAETRTDFGAAVSEALGWLGTTPETAGALLGINGRTLDAMCQGIVPMRSIVIRFASGIARHCDRQSGAPEWWRDVDEWLRLAGYGPRRDAAPDEEAPPQAQGPSGAWKSVRAPSPRAPRVPLSPDEMPARHYYHPVYERKAWGDEFVHVFWILDDQDRQVFHMSMPATENYRARAEEVKRDLANLSRPGFERKYARFRVNRESKSGPP